MIRSESRNGVRILTLARGKGNALDVPFLRRIVEEIEREAGSGLVLTGEGSIFCAGLDLVELLELDRSGMQELLDALYRVHVALFAYPRPVVGALNGHAIAGGALLSLCCDLRIMAQGDAKWGLNESALGLSIPAFGLEVARYSLPRPILEKVVYGGAVYPAFKALDMGALDRLVEIETLIDAAAEQAEVWCRQGEAFTALKRDLHAPTLAAMAAARAQDEPWLDLWFSPPAQSLLQSARERLLSRSQSSS